MKLKDNIKKEITEILTTPAYPPNVIEDILKVVEKYIHQTPMEKVENLHKHNWQKSGGNKYYRLYECTKCNWVKGEKKPK